MRPRLSRCFLDVNFFTGILRPGTVGLRAAQLHHELRKLVRAYVQRLCDPLAVPIVEFVYRGAPAIQR
jgi:hypothetical protein